MTVCTTNLQSKRDKNKTKYHRHESGRGKNNRNFFSRDLKIFLISDFKVFKTELFWNHLTLTLTKSGSKLYVISCLSVIKDV